MSLVPPEVAADPAKLREMLDRADQQQRQHKDDLREVDAIAKASGMHLDEPPQQQSDG